MEIIRHCDRLGIESRPEFVARNLAWWRERPRSEEEAGRKHLYEQFLDACSFPRAPDKDWHIGEVGAGPYGGILRLCQIQCRLPYYIDYIQQELCELGFIDWPAQAVYVTAPAENIPLADRILDAVISYNSLDHGWDIRQALRECFRIARECYLSFDCRGDNPDQVQSRQGIDKDHWQLLRYEEVCRIVTDLLPGRPWSMRDLGINSLFPVVLIVVEE